jgi:hypothetical protein
MKTTNLIKIAAAVLLGIAVCGNVQADNDKYTRSSRATLERIAHVILVVGMEIPEMERFSAPPVEDWMLDTDYLKTEAVGGIEPWMKETDYLGEVAQPLESWMFDEMRLEETTSGTSLEPWMLDTNYLSK